VEPVRSIKAVLEDPRYQAAPAEVKAFYWSAVGLLWEGAERTGKGPRLKRGLLPGAAALVDWGLALEVDGEVEIGWLTREWIRADARRSQCRLAGKASGARRTSNEPLTNRSTDVQRTFDSPDISRVALPEPCKCEVGETFALLPELPEGREEKNYSQRTRAKHAYSVGFERFWKAYPVKREKPQAFATWKKLGCEALTDSIVAKVTLLMAEDNHWQRGFAKWPERWLKAEGWDDEPIRDPNAEPPTKWRVSVACPRCHKGYFEDQGHQCLQELHS
jgi:hypothetical protein